MSVLSKAALKAAFDALPTPITRASLETLFDNTFDSYQDTLPQLTTAAINALTPTLNQLVYNTDRNYIMQYNGSIWVYLVAMFIGTEAEVASAADKAGQLYFDTTNSYYLLGTGAGKGRVQTAESCTCVKTVKVSLSSAQILTSNTTPIQLIAAPGAGKVIVPISIQTVVNFNTVAYATNTGGFINYNGINGGEITANVFGIGVSETTFFHNDLYYTSGALAIVENLGVRYVTQDGNPTAGDGTIDFYITYQVITL